MNYILLNSVFISFLSYGALPLSPATSDSIIPLLITAVAAAVALLIIRKFRSGK